MAILTLLGFVAQTTSLVWSRWSRGTVHLGQLSVLPASYAQQEAEHVALLLAIQLLHILIRTHRETLDTSNEQMIKQYII